MKAFFKKMFVLFFILSFWNLALAMTDDERAKKIEVLAEQQKKHFPQGPLDDVEYVKKMINFIIEYDQQVRKLFSQIQAPLNYPAACNAFIRVDEFNLKQLKPVLAKYGWLTISRFGKEVDHNAWLLVQHADRDPFFQAGCAFILEQLVKIKETSTSNFAYLYDRVASKEIFNSLGFKQRYGTQAKPSADGTKIELFPYEGTLEELDVRRREIGLQPIEEYMKQLKQVYIDKVDPAVLEKSGLQK